ncbi:MAG TPA: hypothetical protein VLH79_02840 [Chthonomonadales bacterium]|nr:hypothetical protein [Chthonomonadales bacterium]
MLLGTILFSAIASTLLAGAILLARTHYARAHTDADHARALDLAEAGINYQFHKVSANPDQADQYPGATRSLGGGQFRVWCTARASDGTESTPWTPPGYLYVYAEGNANGVKRTIRVSARGFAAKGDYAIYTMDSTSVWNGSSLTVAGDIGTNGIYRFSGTPTITGSVTFCGPDAGWFNGVNPGPYTVYRQPRRTEFATVAQKALEMFPAATHPPGGLAYLRLNNNNATAATPAIVGNSVTNTVTIRGPANIYLENLNLTGSRTINIDNRNGPVNIWIGPEGGPNVARFRGGTAVISPQPEYDPDAPGAIDRRCIIFVATQGGIDLAGNQVMDASVYAYNRDAFGRPFGLVRNSGNPTINGQILANQVDINGNVTINYRKTLPGPTSVGYYGYDNSWIEVRPR